MAVTAAAHAPEHVGALVPRRFYARMAWVFLAVGLIGFGPTYWVPLLRGTLQVQPLTHLHALLFYGWLVLFAWQASLVAAGRTPRHREWGVAGVSIATAMLFVGLATAVQSMRAQEAAGLGEAARAFSIVPVSGIVLFAALVGAAVLNVKRPDVHKRLMLVATASILAAAVARWFLLFGPGPPPVEVGAPLSPPPVLVSLFPAFLVDLPIVAAMIHDHRTRGRVHPTYWLAGGVVLAVQILRVPLSGTGAWLRVTEMLLALVP